MLKLPPAAVTRPAAEAMIRNNPARRARSISAAATRSPRTSSWPGVRRTAQALAGLFGIPLSPGTVAGITVRAAGRPGGFLERAREEIAASPVAGFDETGFRAQARLHWVHCARTGKYTLLMVHPRRGANAMEVMGVLPSFAGVAVHDAWAPYDTYTTPRHQQCAACAGQGRQGRVHGEEDVRLRLICVSHTDRPCLTGRPDRPLPSPALWLGAEWEHRGAASCGHTR